MRFSFWQVPNLKNSEFPYLRNKVCKMHFVLCICNNNNNNNPINGILQCSTILTNIKFKNNIFGLDLLCFTPIPIKSNKYIKTHTHTHTHTHTILLLGTQQPNRLQPDKEEY
jgi:hypothetical protein